MFNNYAAIKKILKDLNDIIAYCTDCAALSTNENAQELFQYARDELECILYDVATNDWDEEEDEDEEDEDEEGGNKKC